MHASKILFFRITVHTVHLIIFPFSIIKISGDELVKSEQSILHPGKGLAVLFAASCRIGMQGGGKKVFSGFIVHSVHPAFFHFIFIALAGEYTVKGEQ
ncbi:hypothetical protein ACXNAM_22420 [Kluyvera cryocrescens]